MHRTVLSLLLTTLALAICAPSAGLAQTKKTRTRISKTGKTSQKRPAPTTAKLQSFRHGPWTIYHSFDAAWAIKTGSKKRVSLWSKMPPEDRENCPDYNFQARLVSVVGPFVSMEKIEGGYCKGAAHPFAWHAFQAVKLDTKEQTAKPTTLNALFGRKRVNSAVKRDPYIKKHSKNEDWDCLVDQSFGGDHFAFNHLGKGKVAVRLGQPHGCEVARGRFTELGFWFKPSKQLMRWLKIANRRGLLGKHLRGKKW